MTLGSRLREYIQGSGMNIKEFSSSVGIPYRSIHEYLSDNRSPGTDHIIKFMENGVNLEWLLLGDIRPQVNFILNEPTLKPISGICAANPALLSFFMDKASEEIEIYRQKPDGRERYIPIGTLVLFIWVLLEHYSIGANSLMEHIGKDVSKKISVEELGNTVSNVIRPIIQEKLNEIGEFYSTKRGATE